MILQDRWASTSGIGNAAQPAGTCMGEARDRWARTGTRERSPGAVTRPWFCSADPSKRGLTIPDLLYVVDFDVFCKIAAPHESLPHSSHTRVGDISSTRTQSIHARWAIEGSTPHPATIYEVILETIIVRTRIANIRGWILRFNR